ncbi:Hypothetical protein CpCap5W_1035 [Corynebacterium pseudotuberculosis]|nr:Hypothetical protein CpPAT10_1633 [Corynebacterium pseudotuberculosis PAT10]AEP70865.1 Hypothetical protein Cp4202_1622 [Corynebacterium pseudotuberculosis 42/02-A]AEX40129.1 Hypothetical protein Cp3995_1674 [Corynebacterium pseudotuberculosis 3/99-5]AFF22784.1 Hypothetical protein CpP54B96_1660 [Corynebacterium pseudotuberculosis P54B96]AFH52582.1 Hypothetical protein Cp267_1698 [Corynebacterium pseudotuberculosis 267]AJC14366.1 hypothetical protein CpVD57_1664 [Corynebacterium pseudotuber
MKENQFETFPRENSSAAITHQTPPSLDKTHLILSFYLCKLPLLG